jgi:cyclic pyranopterin phosphate synthase
MEEDCMISKRKDDVSPAILHDRFGRELNSVRISVTQRCNLECFYCHGEGEIASWNEMTAEEIAKIAEVACQLGMKKVKLTGGEPLLREDLPQIVSLISRHTHEVSLTTNGVLLEKNAHTLAEAGLKRVNVSLPSPTPKNFQKITGRSYVQKVKNGIKSAVQSHLHPVKINMVLLKGINVNEVPETVDFAQEVGAILQIIEFQPILPENYAYWKKFHYDPLPIENRLKRKADAICENPLHKRRRYTLRKDGSPSRVEIVRPMHNSTFCKNCTRLRITADGKLKPCLLRNDNLVDIISPIRKGASSIELETVFKKAAMLREPYWKEERERHAKTNTRVETVYQR